MKKLSVGKSALAALALAASPSVFADITPLFEFSAGAGSWSTEFSGEVGSENNLASIDELGLKDSDNTFFYVQFEHPIPLVPNLRLDLTSISTDGSGTLDNTYEIGDTVFPAGTEIISEMDLDFTDAILYYEVAILDFGLNFRKFDVEITATESSSGETATESVDVVLPMVFLQADVELPFTGLYVMGNVNVISYDDKSVTDYRAAVGYGIELSVLSEIGLELGYRSFEIDLGEDDDIAGDVEMSGLYFGANITF
ncbi:hypothetical protein TDB9533_03963 [Thalassocella blandensis]|nr:hypothetical protein TDB9533_03963 [Thalassocella blandensis]